MNEKKIEKYTLKYLDELNDITTVAVFLRGCQRILSPISMILTYNFLYHAWVSEREKKCTNIFLNVKKNTKITKIYTHLVSRNLFGVFLFKLLHGCTWVGNLSISSETDIFVKMNYIPNQNNVQ